MAAIGYFVGRWLDSFQRCEVLMYDLEGGAESAYRDADTVFDSLMACKGKWLMPVPVPGV